MKIIFKSLLFLSVAGCISNTVIDTNLRSVSEAKVQSLNQEELQALWGPSNFADPNQHKKENYTYLVHASAQLEFYDKVLPRRKLSGFGRLSVSVINQDHVGTFRNAGVILSIPQKNFIAASDEDMGECDANETLDILKACFSDRYKRFGLPSPQEILQRTEKKDPTHWNEIFVSETPLAVEDPVITALFLRFDNFGHCLAEIKLCRRLQELSLKYNYPLIKIEPPRNEIWLVGYPKGGKVETSFGYFFRNPPFDEIYLPISENNYKALETATQKSGKTFYITTSEFTYGATPVGAVIGDSFFHIISKSSFDTIMRSNITHQYIFSNKATPIVFSSEK